MQSKDHLAAPVSDAPAVDAVAAEFAMSLYASSADRSDAMLAEIARLRAEVEALRARLSQATGHMATGGRVVIEDCQVTPHREPPR